MLDVRPQGVPQRVKIVVTLQQGRSELIPVMEPSGSDDYIDS
jgi:hypothetical protein